MSDAMRWLEVLQQPLQILHRCPACYEAEGAAAGDAGGTRRLRQTCSRHVRRRGGCGAAGRPLQLLQRILAELDGRGEALLLRQGVGASRRGEEELP